MKALLKRALCAALSLALVPGAASAQSFAERFPAIATGLGIPGGTDVDQSVMSPASGRAILVDAASAQLFMIESGRIVDSMKVVVGKPSAETPPLRSAVTWATLNPYWNVPPDLARTLIAPRVLEEGLSYLDKHGYEVVTGFDRQSEPLPANSVDWQSVADGATRVYVRQKPGPGNSMGQVKFTIADSEGIYLHDTPKKELFAQERREFSNGCVRLEDAPRLARWLLGREPRITSSEPEQHVPLPTPVPIVITRLEQAGSVQVAALR